jgi:hypothetical protein
VRRRQRCRPACAGAPCPCAFLEPETRSAALALWSSDETPPRTACCCFRRCLPQLPTRALLACDCGTPLPPNNNNNNSHINHIHRAPPPPPAVSLVVLVTAGNNYQKERQFRVLQAAAADVQVGVWVWVWVWAGFCQGLCQGSVRRGLREGSVRRAHSSSSSSGSPCAGRACHACQAIRAGGWEVGQLPCSPAAAADGPAAPPPWLGRCGRCAAGGSWLCP